jgi:pimeloyl-ACP methyl ester carboxylesterase
MKTITIANGAELYHEVTGHGPALLLIPGASGDGGWFDAVIEPLALRYTVVTYDRRGNSRSPRPIGWTTTSIAEQAQDAASLLRALDLEPATVFGTSLGAIITLQLVADHPEVVTRAIVHEPPLYDALPDAHVYRAQLGQLVEEAMSRGGPPAVIERVLRDVAGVPFDSTPADLRARVLQNGDVFVGAELPAMAGYLPDFTAVRATGVPVLPLSGTASGGPSRSIVEWLADGLGVAPGKMEGGHVPYVTHPDGTVTALMSETSPQAESTP